MRSSCTSAARKSSRGRYPLSDSIETDKEGNALELMDVVGVDDTMLDDIHDRDSALRLRQMVVGPVPDSGREALDHPPAVTAWGAPSPLTQREVASSFGISRSYVSRIEKRALEKLRQALEEPVARHSPASGG